MSMDFLKDIDTECVATLDQARTGSVLSVFLPKESLRRVVNRLAGEEYFLEDVTALDAAEGFLVLYHFDHFERPGRIVLRVLIPRSNPKVPSIADIFQGAEWHERETMDFFGISFIGNPNPVPLLLDPSETIHPLLKEPAGRVSLKTLLPSGEIVSCDPGFTLIKAEAESGKGA